MKITTMSLIGVLSFSASAGLFDGLKSVGTDLIDGAGKLANATVNVTTSCVESVTKGGISTSASSTGVVSEGVVDKTTDSNVASKRVNSGNMSAKSEKETAKELAVEYLSLDFARQMNELMAKDKRGDRYRGSPRHFYTYVSMREFRTQWQPIERSSYPNVPDLIPGNISVPSTVSEFERWKTGVQTRLEKEYSYWKEAEKSRGVRLAKFGSGNARDGVRKLDERAKQVGQGQPCNECDSQSKNTDAGMPQAECQSSLDKELNDFLEKQFRPQVKEFQAALNERYEGFHDTIWSKFGDNTSDKKLVHDRLVKEFGEEFCKRWESQMFSGSDNERNPSWVASRMIKEPWNDATIHWVPTNVYEQTTLLFFGEDGWPHEGDYIENGNPKRLLDRLQTKCGAEDRQLWMSAAKDWLARTRKAIDKECFVDGYSAKWFAEAHGGTNCEPLQVYRNIAFGDSVGTVFKKLKAIDQDVNWKDPNGSIFKGKHFAKYPNGKVLQTELKSHKLMFIFGAMEENAGSALVFVKITFKDAAPSCDELSEKYMRLPSAKMHKEKIEVGRKWKTDEVSTFWRSFCQFSEAQLMLSASSGSGELGEMSGKEQKGQAKLSQDLSIVKQSHTEGMFVDATVIESSVGTVSVRVMSDTGKVADVIIEDRLMTGLMEKKQNEFAIANANREKLEKEAAAKKARSEAVSF